MATMVDEIQIPARKIVDTMVVKITMTGMRRTRFRIWIGGCILHLASIVSGMSFIVEMADDATSATD